MKRTLILASLGIAAGAGACRHTDEGAPTATLKDAEDHRRFSEFNIFTASSPSPCFTFESHDLKAAELEEKGFVADLNRNPGMRAAVLKLAGQDADAVVKDLFVADLDVAVGNPFSELVFSVDTPSPARTEKFVKSCDVKPTGTPDFAIRSFEKNRAVVLQRRDVSLDIPEAMKINFQPGDLPADGRIKANIWCLNGTTAGTVEPAKLTSDMQAQAVGLSFDIAGGTYKVVGKNAAGLPPSADVTIEGARHQGRLADARIHLSYCPIFDTVSPSSILEFAFRRDRPLIDFQPATQVSNTDLRGAGSSEKIASLQLWSRESDGAVVGKTLYLCLSDQSSQDEAALTAAVAAALNGGLAKTVAELQGLSLPHDPVFAAADIRKLGTVRTATQFFDRSFLSLTILNTCESIAKDFSDRIGRAMTLSPF